MALLMMKGWFIRECPATMLCAGSSKGKSYPQIQINIYEIIIFACVSDLCAARLKVARPSKILQNYVRSPPQQSWSKYVEVQGQILGFHRPFYRIGVLGQQPWVMERMQGWISLSLSLSQGASSPMQNLGITYSLLNSTERAGWYHGSLS